MFEACSWFIGLNWVFIFGCKPKNTKSLFPLQFKHFMFSKFIVSPLRQIVIEPKISAEVGFGFLIEIIKTHVTCDMLVLNELTRMIP